MTKSAESTPLRESAVMRALLLGILLMIAWLLWSGFFKPLLLSLGAFSCLLTLLIVYRMGYFTNETFAFRYSPRLFVYWIWLGKEIVLSSIDVIKHVLRKDLNVQSTVITLDVSDLDALDQAVFGNSITLTPGTLTLDLFKDRIVVHALSAEAAESLKNGEMFQRVVALKDD